MTNAYEWRGRIGEVWAEEWRRTDRSLAPVNAALVAEAVAEPPPRDRPRILDIGCGAGATSLALADALGEAEITGIDLSEALVAAARARGAGRKNLRFEVADATRWSPADSGYELIVSRHGVMFFEDPVGAFAHFRALGGSDARLVFSCFRAAAENEWVAALRPILDRFDAAPAGAERSTGPFAFADPKRIESILTEAGFAAPRIRALDFYFVVGAGADPLADAIAYFRRIGPFAAMLRELDDGAAEAAVAQLAGIAAAHRAGEGIVFQGAAWIVSARVPTP
jgi:SAM-dependent methyltransferase